MKDWLSIGQFSKRVGVSPRAIRFYEKMGLLESISRGENGYRYFRENQISTAKKIGELKAFGFSLKEIKSLLESSCGQLDGRSIHAQLKQRLIGIQEESQRLSIQKDQIQDILSSISKKHTALKESERNYVMGLYKKATIAVSGIENLDRTAEYISEFFRAADQEIQILHWPEVAKKRDLGLPAIVIIPEAALAKGGFESLRPDVVVIKNVSTVDRKTLDLYRQLFTSVGPHMSTVLNADDRVSIEIAKDPEVQKGRIFYYSKNTGLRDQIKEIGGTVSDGEEITLYGKDQERHNLKITTQNIRAHQEEVALLAAITTVLDIGIKGTAFLFRSIQRQCG